MGFIIKLYKSKNSIIKILYDSIIKLNGGAAKGTPLSASFDAAFNIPFARFLSRQCQDPKMPRPTLHLVWTTNLASNISESFGNGFPLVSIIARALWAPILTLSGCTLSTYGYESVTPLALRSCL